MLAASKKAESAMGRHAAALVSAVRFNTSKQALSQVSNWERWAGETGTSRRSGDARNHERATHDGANSGRNRETAGRTLDLAVGSE